MCYGTGLTAQFSQIHPRLTHVLQFSCGCPDRPLSKSLAAHALDLHQLTCEKRVSINDAYQDSNAIADYN